MAKKPMTWSEWSESQGGVFTISNEERKQMRKDRKANADVSTHEYTREEILQRMRDLRSDWNSDIERGADMSRVIGSAGGIDQTYGDYYRQRMEQLQRYLSAAGKNTMQGNTEDAQGVYSAIRGANSFLDDMDTQLSSMPTAAATLPSQQEDEDPRLMERVRNWFAERRALLQAAEQRKNEEWFADREAKYGNITSRPDFAQNSVGWEEQTGYAGRITENTPEAEAYRNYLMYTPDNMRDPELEQRLREAYEQSSRAHVDESIPMTDEEKQVYQYLLNTEGEEAAQDYYDYISYAVNERQMADLMQQAEGNTETGLEKTLASIGSVPANLIGGAAGVVDILKQNVRNQFGEYRPVDYNSGAQQLANYGQAVRENTMEDMGNVGQFLYGTGMSMADSLASIAVGGQAGGVLLGLSAAQSAVQDAHERGATDTQALASGIFAGTAEMVFERIGIDNLFKVANAGMTDSVHNIVKGIVSQMLAEGSEEVGTTIANTITDALIMADKSALNTAIAEYEAQGMSHEEATRQAWRDWAKNLAMDFLGGAVSGGVMGGGAQAIGTYGTGRAIQQSGQAQDVVDYATQFGSDAAKALAQRAGTGDNASAMQLGRMFSNIENPVTTADGGVDVRATIDRRIAQLEQETAQRQAKAARRKAQAAAASETAQEASAQTAEEVVEKEQKPAQAVKTAANTTQEAPATTAKKTRAMTVRDAKGNSVELVDVTTGQDENLAFVTADGKQISVDDINFDGAPKAMQIANYAGRMNVDGARGLMANYDGGDAVAYARPYTVVYERAKRNVSMQDAVRNIKGLSDAAIQAAYTAGQVERMANEGTQETRGGVIRSFTSSISETKERALEVLDAMASAIGRTLVVTDTINYVAADGTVRTSGSNAQFDPKTNRYTIALDAVDESYINVFAHETVHDIETNSPEDFALLREVVFDWLEQSGKDIEQMRQVQRDLAKGYDDAYYDAEIVANSVAVIFGERKTFRRFMDEFMNEDSYSHEHRRVFMELVDRVLKFIQDALDELSKYRSWSQIKALRQQRDMIEAVRDAYFAGLKNAVQQEAQGEGDTRESAKDTDFTAENWQRVLDGSYAIMEDSKRPALHREKLGVDGRVKSRPHRPVENYRGDGWVREDRALSASENEYVHKVARRIFDGDANDGEYYRTDTRDSYIIPAYSRKANGIYNTVASITILSRDNIIVHEVVRVEGGNNDKWMEDIQDEIKFEGYRWMGGRIPAEIVQAIYRKAVFIRYTSHLGLEVFGGGGRITGTLGEEIVRSIAAERNGSGIRAEDEADQSVVRQSLKDDLEAENRQLRRDVRTAQTEAEKAGKRAERAEKRYERTSERLTETKERYAGYREGVSYRRYRDRMTRLVNELFQLAANPSSKKNVPENMRAPIAGFLRELDMAGRRVTEKPKAPTHPGENATKEQLTAYKARMTVYQRQLESYETGMRQKTGRSEQWSAKLMVLANKFGKADIDFALGFAPDLVDKMTAFAEANANVSISEMSAAQLRELTQILSQIKGAVSKANKQLRTEQAIETKALATATVQEAQARKNFNNSARGNMHNLGMHSGVGQMDALSYFERIGPAGEAIGKELRAGQDDFITRIRETVEFAGEAFTPKEAKAWQDPKAAKTFQLQAGEVTLTPAQIMDLYLLNARGDARSHLEGDGIEVIRKKGRKTVYEQSRVTQEDINEMVGTLTPRQLEVAKKLQSFMQTAAEWGNQATMEAYGFKRFGETDYWRMKVSGTSVASKADASVENADLYALINTGLTKQTQKNAKNALIIEDVFTAFSEHCAEMAEFSAYLVPIIDAMKWYNWKGVDASGRSISTQNALRDSFGDDATKFFESFMRQLNGGASRNVPRTFIDKAMRLVKRASVGVNLSVIIQQPTAYVRALAEIDPKYLAKGTVGGWHVDLAKKYCPIVYWKSLGYFDTGTGKSVADKITNAGTWIEQASELQMTPAGKADEIAWNALWNACYAEQMDKHKGMDYKSEAFYQIVGARLSEVIDKTQVVDSVFHRSAIAASGAAQTFTAFSSEMMKGYNLLTNAFYEAKFYHDKEHKQKLYRAVGAHAANALAAAMAQALVGAWRDEDEDKTDEWIERALIRDGSGKYTYWQRWRVRAVENAFDNIAPWNLLWISKTAIEFLGGAFSTSARVDTKLFSALGNVVADAKKISDACAVVSKNEDLYELNNADTFYERVLAEAGIDPNKVLYRAVSAFSYSTGFGFTNLWRDAQGILRSIKRPNDYTLKDGLYFIEHNNLATASVAINEALEIKTEEIAAEYPQYTEERAREVATSKLRSQITGTYKKDYVQAFIKGYTNRAEKIRSHMIATGLYEDAEEVDSILQDWAVAELKDTYLTARTDAQRERAIEFLWQTGKWGTRAELNAQLQAWREG